MSTVLQKPFAEQFREPQAGGVEQLHDRLVAQAEAVVGAELEQSRHRVGIEGRRQPLAGLGGRHVGGGVVGHFAFAGEAAEQAADCRQPALHAARREPAAMRLGGEAAHVLRVEAIPLVDALRRAILEQRGEVAGIGGFRVRRQPPLDSKALQEPGDPACERLAHALRAAIASLTMSPMRTRKSVLIVGR